MMDSKRVSNTCECKTHSRVWGFLFALSAQRRRPILIYVLKTISSASSDNGVSEYLGGLFDIGAQPRFFIPMAVAELLHGAGRGL